MIETVNLSLIQLFFRQSHSRKAISIAIAVCFVAGCSKAESTSQSWDPSVEIGPIAETGSSRVGSFGVRCGYTHSANDDPIVFSNQPRASHSHDFFGAVGINSSTSLSSLKVSESACDSSGDVSAYWTPTLYADGVAVKPIESAAYYRAQSNSDLDEITVPPNGLEMLSVGAEWTCARVDDPTVEVPNCPETSLTRLLLVFPDCWDGEHLSSDDHKSHLSVSDNGRCPRSHPVAMTRLILEVRYKIPVGSTLTLASGDIITAHGDAIINWDSRVIEQELKYCVKRSINCDLTWNTTIGY